MDNCIIYVRIGEKFNFSLQNKLLIFLPDVADDAGAPRLTIFGYFELLINGDLFWKAQSSIFRGDVMPFKRFDSFTDKPFL